jgi:hypothetical protein
MKANRGLDISELRSLRGVFERYPEVQAVYAFGSVAAGNADESSDLDLAVISAQPSLREKKLEILASLARLGYCNVDLVFVDEDDLVLAYEVIRQNKLIYASPDFDRGATYSRIVRKYLDFIPYLRIQREAYKRRVIRDQA